MIFFEFGSVSVEDNVKRLRDTQNVKNVEEHERSDLKLRSPDNGQEFKNLHEGGEYNCLKNFFIRNFLLPELDITLEVKHQKYKENDVFQKGTQKSTIEGKL
jgi:hypothetical protein